MKQVKEWSLTFQCDHQQYWQGHRIACTNYDECATGCGSTPREALEGALEDLAQQDIKLSDVQKKEITEELQSQIAEGYDLDTDIMVECEHGLDPDSDPDCTICAGEWFCYVSIDVITDVDDKAIPEK